MSKELAIPYRDLRLLDPEVQLACMLLHLAERALLLKLITAHHQQSHCT